MDNKKIQLRLFNPVTGGDITVTLKHWVNKNVVAAMKVQAEETPLGTEMKQKFGDVMDRSEKNELRADDIFSMPALELIKVQYQTERVRRVLNVLIDSATVPEDVDISSEEFWDEQDIGHCEEVVQDWFRSSKRAGRANT